jgi:HPt (histidine-containing phosphotransfer) domain-containing protein
LSAGKHAVVLASSASLLDLEVVSRLREDFEPAQLESLLATFNTTLHERLDRLQGALDRTDQLGADAILHSLKGSSASFGARKLSEAVVTLRSQLDTERAACVAAVVQLREIAVTTVAQLRTQLL